MSFPFFTSTTKPPTQRMPLVAPPADEEVGTTTTTARESGKTSAFLSNDNLCGRTLLELVGRGHSILADIKILSERVPPAILVAANLDGKTADAKSSASEEKGGFLNIFGQTSAAKSSAKPNNPSSEGEPSQDTDDVKKYVPFLFDFSYLHNPQEWEASLSLPESSTHKKGESKDGHKQTSSAPAAESSESLLELEREFAVNHRKAIEEFYELFYSIYDYQVALNQFSSDLTKGFFIQYTVESVLLDLEGRALLCEAVWLYGVMLMLMERLLPVSDHIICTKVPLIWYQLTLHLLPSSQTGTSQRKAHHCVLSLLWERWRYLTD